MKKVKTDANGKKLKKKVKRDVAKVLNKNTLERKRLLGMNPYLQTLLDPFNVLGVKIPDMNSHPSGSFQILDRREIVINANGVACICYGAYGASGSSGQGGSLVPVRVAGTGSVPYAIGMTNGALASSVDLLLGGSPIYLTNWTSVSDPIVQTYVKARLVSAGTCFQYLGAPLNAKGKASLGFAPRNQLRSNISSGLTVDMLLKLPGSKTVPVNTLSGGVVLYQPQDGVSLEYVDTNSVSTATNGSVWDTDANLRAACGGEMYISFTGCNPGDVIQITSAFNYEAIPRTNTWNLVGVSLSPNDPIALTHAFNTVQTSPVTLATTQPILLGSGSGVQQSSSSEGYVPHPFQPSSQPVSSGMGVTENKQQMSNPTGMFDSFLSSAVGFAKDIPKYVEQLSPLLEGVAALL